MPTFRKDVKDMTSEEKERFVRALHELKKKKSGKVGSIYDEFVAIHGALMDLFASKSRATLLTMGHKKTSFLTWHRHFLYRLEEELKQVDEKVFLPYWDWTSEESTKAVFSPDFLGTPVSGGVSAVELKDGKFKGDVWTDLDFKPLKRNNGSISNLIEQQKKVFDLLVTSSKQKGDNSFVHFATQLESIHDFAHVWVGGHMGSIGTAVADPVFFLNHCNVDRFFAMWQDYGNVDSYPSTGQSFGNNRNDVLWPWDGGKAMPEADRLRDYIRDADPSHVITNGGMLNYRTWRYSYDKPMGELSTSKKKITNKLDAWGASHIYDLDIKDTANYRIYTTGNTDVQMEVYGPALCANCFGQLKAFDDNSGDSGINPSVSITLQPGKYFVVIRCSTIGKGGEYTITCSQRSNAIRLTLERPFRAALSAMWEIDWYDFKIEKQGFYVIETTGNTDTMLLLYGQNVPLDLLARDDNSGVNKNAQIKINLAPGQYHAAVRSSNTSIGKYNIVVRQ